METKSSQPLIVDITEDEPLPSFASFLREGEEDFSKWDREHVSLVIQSVCQRQLSTVRLYPKRRISFQCCQHVWIPEMLTFIQLRNWGPSLDRLPTAKQQGIWKVCHSIPTFNNFVRNSFEKTIKKWDSNSVANMMTIMTHCQASISVLYSAIRFLQAEGLLGELPSKQSTNSKHWNVHLRDAFGSSPPSKIPSKPVIREDKRHDFTQCLGCKQLLRHPVGAEVIRCPKCSSIIVNSPTAKVSPSVQESGVKVFYLQAKPSSELSRMMYQDIHDKSQPKIGAAPKTRTYNQPYSLLPLTHQPGLPITQTNGTTTLSMPQTGSNQIPLPTYPTNNISSPFSSTGTASSVPNNNAAVSPNQRKPTQPIKNFQGITTPFNHSHGTTTTTTTTTTSPTQFQYQHARHNTQLPITLPLTNAQTSFALQSRSGMMFSQNNRPNPSNIQPPLHNPHLPVRTQQGGINPVHYPAPPLTSPPFMPNIQQFSPLHSVPNIPLPNTNLSNLPPVPPILTPPVTPPFKPSPTPWFNAPLPGSAAATTSPQKGPVLPPVSEPVRTVEIPLSQKRNFEEIDLSLPPLESVDPDSKKQKTSLPSAEA